MKLQDLLVHGETVSVQMFAIAALQQATVFATGQVERVNGAHDVSFTVGPFSLAGGIEVEVGEWYIHHVTPTGPVHERTLTARLGSAALAVWQRSLTGDGDEQ